MVQTRKVSDLENKYTNIDDRERIEDLLDAADKMARETEKRYTHEEIFARLRGEVND